MELRLLWCSVDLQLKRVVVEILYFENVIVFFVVLVWLLVLLLVVVVVMLYVVVLLFVVYFGLKFFVVSGILLSGNCFALAGVFCGEGAGGQARSVASVNYGSDANAGAIGTTERIVAVTAGGRVALLEEFVGPGGDAASFILKMLQAPAPAGSSLVMAPSGLRRPGM